MTDFETLRKINEYLKARVVALELALEFYADEANWEVVKDSTLVAQMNGVTKASRDQGQRAREARVREGD